MRVVVTRAWERNDLALVLFVSSRFAYFCFVYTIMYVAIEFEWDPQKAELNLKKHGVSFETATEAFSDPNQVAGENYYYDEDGEQRE